MPADWLLPAAICGLLTSRGSANALTSAKACDFILSVPIVHPLQSRHCVPLDELSSVQLTFVVAETDSPCCDAGAALGEAVLPQ